MFFSLLGFQDLAFLPILHQTWVLSSPPPSDPESVSLVSPFLPPQAFILKSNGLIEQFHRSLKAALRSRLASSDWFQHLPLVILGLCSIPKDNTRLSVFKAVFRAPLTVPGEFLDSLELPPAEYLSKIEQAVVGFAVSPPHHVLKTQPLSAALMSARYVFVGEDASIPSLAPLYCGPCLVLEKSEKYFRLQLGSRTDVVSMDRLKPVFLI